MRFGYPRPEKSTECVPLCQRSGRTAKVQCAKSLLKGNCSAVVRPARIEPKIYMSVKAEDKVAIEKTEKQMVVCLEEYLK